MTRRLHTAAAVVLGILLPAPAASAAQLPPAVQEVFRDFSRDGIISPCKHTVGDLRETRDNIPPDIDQYAPDFPEAVRAALEAHARGECAEGGSAGGSAGAGAAPATGAPGSTPPATSGVSPAVAAPPGTPTKTVASEPPAPDAAVAEAATAGEAPSVAPELARVAARTASSDAPAPVWIAAGGAAVLGLALLATLLAGRTRRGAAGLDQLRHSWGEAAWRASATWTDFREWVRTGR